MPKAMCSSNTNEYETPPKLFNKLNAEFHFTLDPCATNKNTKCQKYYTKEDDGLSKSWHLDIVFMNPPYGRKISKWIRKAYLESTLGAIVVCLIPARTDTIYWHKYIFPCASEIRWIKKRIKFTGCKNSAPFPSAIVIFNIKVWEGKPIYKTMEVE